MKDSTRRRPARSLSSARRAQWLLGCLVFLSCSWQLRHARAQDLLVVESSREDAPAADKLAALLERPMRRVRSQAGASTACRERGIAYALVLDSEHHVVQLLRCHDRTLLTRVVTTADGPPTPYVSAFIAAELLALGGELAEERAAPEPPARLRLQLRTSLEYMVDAGVYSGRLRPNLAAGLAFQPPGVAVAFVSEFGAAPLAAAQRDFAVGQLSLLRTDGFVRLGAILPLGPIALGAYGQVLCALTRADFRAETTTSSQRATWSVGAGLEIRYALFDWLDLLGSMAADLALNRSDYRFQGSSLLRDPPRLIQLGAGLLFAPRL